MNKTIMDRMPTTPDVNQERLEQLRALMPDLFTNDGALNPDELKRLIDPDLVPESERFEFRWFGKADAKRNAFTPTLASLEYDHERSVNPELADFTDNVVFRAWDSYKEATVCLDYDLKEQTIASLKGMKGIFVCLEQALFSMKKWILRVEFGERLVAF